MADQGTEGLLSPFLRRRRIAAVLPFLQGRVLDVGCGSGSLAGLLPSQSYVGIDSDQESLMLAKKLHPDHLFLSELPQTGDFDTIVLLAVIEHIAAPDFFVRQLSGLLRKDKDARLCLTTPHPVGKELHQFCARFGICSEHAAEEHEKLLSRKCLQSLAGDQLELTIYRRFLYGLNQLAVYKWRGY